MFHAELGAEEIELVLSGGGALAQAEEAVGKRLAFVDQHARDLHPGRALRITQEPTRVRCSLRRRCARRPSALPGRLHEEVATAVLVCHVGQVFDVDTQVVRLLGLEAAMHRLWLFRLQRLRCPRRGAGGTGRARGARPAD